MQLTITNPHDILKSLKAMGAIVSRTNILPITECLLIEAESELVKFTTTDLATRMSVTAVADIDKPGKALVKFTEMLSIFANSSEEVTIFSAKSGVKVTSGSAAYNLKQANPADYPQMDVSTFAEPFTVGGKELGRAIDAVIAFAHMSDDVVSNIFVDVDGDNLTLIATDKAIISVAVIPSIASGVHRVAIPKEALAALAKAIGDDDVSLQFGESHVRAIVGTSEITTCVSAHAYPDMSAFSKTARGYTNLVKVGKKRLQEAVKKVSFLGAHIVVFEFEGEALTLKVVGSSQGSVTIDDLSVEEPRTIGCHLGSVLKGLDAMHEAEITLAVPPANATRHVGLVMLCNNQALSVGSIA